MHKQSATRRKARQPRRGSDKGKGRRYGELAAPAARAQAAHVGIPATIPALVGHPLPSVRIRAGSEPPASPPSAGRPRSRGNVAPSYSSLALFSRLFRSPPARAVFPGLAPRVFGTVSELLFSPRFFFPFCFARLIFDHVLLRLILLLSFPVTCCDLLKLFQFAGRETSLVMVFKGDFQN